MAENLTDIGVEEISDPELDYHTLNAQLNLYGENEHTQFEADRKVARQYFLQHVNQNTVLSYDLEGKLNCFVREGYYEAEVLTQYDLVDIKVLFERAYAHKFRFPTFLGAFKYYISYMLRASSGKRHPEHFEDRVSMVALYLTRGDLDLAQNLVDEMMMRRFQPATPTFLNAGKKARGELTSCFLLHVEGDMESIARGVSSALQLSKHGGGVVLSSMNLCEAGAPIKRIQSQSSGVMPIMKLLEDPFSYADQLGARQGTGAVHLHTHHPDVLSFLNMKRENADERIHIKTLSLGVVTLGIIFQLVKDNEDIYSFSSYDVERVHEVPFSEISVIKKYYEMVDDGRIHERKINARRPSQTLTEIRFEPSHPYIVFENTVNKANPVKGRIAISNLCLGIPQVSEVSTHNNDLSSSHVGEDIPCNLNSLNIVEAMDSPDFSKTIETVIRGLIAISDLSNIQSAPSIARGNTVNYAIGLRAIDLHGYLTREHVVYGLGKALDFANMYFLSVTYEAIKASCFIAKERGETFEGFADSKYASGEHFEEYINSDWTPKTETCKALPAKSTIHVPIPEGWRALTTDVKRYGMYNQDLQAIPPTGSILYINNPTSSIHLIVPKTETRKKGKTGCVYYPAPFTTNESLGYYIDAYKVGLEKVANIYAAAAQHVDQGLSLTLFYPDTATMRDINKSYIYAWREGIKTLYYIRLRQMALEDTEVQGCISCTL